MMGNGAQAWDDRDIGRGQPRIGARKLEVVGERGQAFKPERQADSNDDLIEPQPYAQQHHDHRNGTASEPAGQESEPQ